jgi:ABC-type dipeptide/oligopeptide/nickel transport system permease subunit
MVQGGAQNIISGQSWVALFPSAAVFITVLILTRIGSLVNCELAGG